MAGISGSIDSTPRIQGDTDDTLIGNVGDRLKVDASSTVTSSRTEPSYQTSLGNAYSAQTASIATSTTETNVIYLKNNSATKTAYIFNAFMFPDPANGSNWVNFKLYYNPTVTANGTALTEANLLAGSANTAACDTFSATTTSSRGSFIRLWGAGFGNSAGVVEDILLPVYYILPPSQSILITGTAKGNGTGVYGNLLWFEV